MRFRCPSSSADVLDQERGSRSGVQQHLSRLTVHGNREAPKAAGPSRLHKVHMKDDNAKRKRSGITHAKKKEIEMAKKKEQLRQHMKNREWSFVFVGNVEPTVDESVLHKAFIHCGEITRIQIRCSRGRAVTVGQAIPAHVRTSRDRQYATIEFAKSSSVKRALKLDGSCLHGAQLVVCISAADLPEVRDIVHRRLGELRERRGMPNPYKPKTNGFRPIPVQNTEQVEEPNSERNSAQSKRKSKHDVTWRDRNVIFGVSWAKCLI